MSSRNAYLTAEERAAAPVLHRALRAGAAAIAAGERDPAEVARRSMADLIAAEPLAELDYAEVVDAGTLAAGRSARPASCACLPQPGSDVPDSSTTRGRPSAAPT